MLNSQVCLVLVLHSMKMSASWTTVTKNRTRFWRNPSTVMSYLYAWRVESDCAGALWAENAYMTQ